MRNIKSKKLNSGFGLLEALVASAILVMFAAGVVVLGNISLRNTVINKHKLQASYLAQDAIEIVRNVRDSNWVDGNPDTIWNTGISNGIQHTILNKSNSGDWWSLDNSTSTPEYFDANCNFVKSTDSNIIFTRTITISNSLPTSHQLQLDVKVSWIDYNKSHNISTTSYLTDWMSY